MFDFYNAYKEKILPFILYRFQILIGIILLLMLDSEKNNTFSNPILQDCISILSESEKELRFKTVLQPLNGQRKAHYHSRVTETFSIIKGELTVWKNNKRQTLYKNQSICIAPFESHRFFNTHPKEEVIFEVKVHPNKDFRKALQIFYGLARDGKTFKNSLPKNPIYAAVGLLMMDAYAQSTIPFFVQKKGLQLLFLIAKYLNIPEKLKTKYCSINENSYK